MDLCKQLVPKTCLKTNGLIWMCQKRWVLRLDYLVLRKMNLNGTHEQHWRYLIINKMVSATLLIINFAHNIIPHHNHNILVRSLSNLKWKATSNFYNGK